MLLSSHISTWLILIGTAFLIIILVFFFLLFVQYNKRQIEHLKQLHDLKTAFSHTLFESQLEIQEQVFTEVSQEIHDNIGQVLSLVRLNIKTLGESPAKEKIDNTDELLGKAIQDLRTITRQLNTNFIKEVGLAEAISQLLASVQSTGQFDTSLDIEDHCFLLDENKSIILFRIVQEIINNIIKHSAASRIIVAITGNESLNTISIADNGKGFDTDIILQHRSGLGISNIIARSRIIGVEVEIKSSLGKGTVVTIHNNQNFSLLPTVDFS